MDKYNINKRILFLFIIGFIFIYTIQIVNMFYYPDEIRIVEGEEQNIDILFPFSLSSSNNKSEIIQSTYNQNTPNNFKKTYKIDPIDSKDVKLQLNFLGLIPIKEFDVSVVNRKVLTPGGNAIGVKLNTKGVLIVAVTDVLEVNDKKHYPAKDGGLKVGDSILEINNIKVKNAEHVVELLNEIQDTTIKILIERNNIEFETEVTPVKSIQDNCYRLGIWVRDKTAGIGTLTFYDEDNKSFGALGHGITDVDTGNLLNIEEGKIINAKIANIEQGKRGSPGEIRGVFYETEDILGEIDKNSSFGIYGSINDDFIKSNEIKSIPIGFKEEVKEGKAYILSTIDDEIEKYEVEILKTQVQKYPNQKSMTIKITDKKLLEKTGGIVQGMSGSPIIQDGKIIGAITHVFVNDPTKGYGIYIEWMLDQLESNNKLSQKAY